MSVNDVGGVRGDLGRRFNVELLIVHPTIGPSAITRRDHFSGVRSPASSRDLNSSPLDFNTSLTHNLSAISAGLSDTEGLARRARVAFGVNHQ